MDIPVRLFCFEIRVGRYSWEEDCWVNVPDMSLFFLKVGTWFSCQVVGHATWFARHVPKHGEGSCYTSALFWSLFERHRYMCWGKISYYFHIVGDGHQPNSGGFYTSYKDSLLKVGWVYPLFLWSGSTPGTYVKKNDSFRKGPHQTSSNRPGAPSKAYIRYLWMNELNGWILMKFVNSKRQSSKIR